MSDIIQEDLDWAEKQKEIALGLRNRGRYEKAIEKLEGVIERLRSHPPDVQAVQISLSDALGQIGGVYDRMGKKELALKKYEEGREVEARHGQDTYNLGNVIRYSVIVRGTDPTSETMREQLKLLADALDAQTTGEKASRADEWWAWADLGQVRLLQGDTKGARRCFDNGRATGPSAGHYARSLEVLEEIRDALPDTAASVRLVMSDEIEHLKANAP